MEPLIKKLRIFHMINRNQALVTITVVTHLVSFVSGRKCYSEKKKDTVVEDNKS